MWHLNLFSMVRVKSSYLELCWTYTMYLSVCCISVPLLESKKIVTQVFPLHDSQPLTELRKSWVRSFCHKQPLGKYLCKMCTFTSCTCTKYHPGLCSPFIHSVDPIILLADSDGPDQMDVQADLGLPCPHMP